jgi:hypothetical protein
MYASSAVSNTHSSTNRSLSSHALWMSLMRSSTAAFLWRRVAGSGAESFGEGAHAAVFQLWPGTAGCLADEVHHDADRDGDERAGDEADDEEHPLAAPLTGPFSFSLGGDGLGNRCDLLIADPSR